MKSNQRSAVLGALDLSPNWVGKTLSERFTEIGGHIRGGAQDAVSGWITFS
jgi:hypothetical protein